MASNNQGKIREFNELLKNIEIELIPQAELGVTEIEETGWSFIENALAKARHASMVTGLPALADDSGLAVAALGGAPGIYSARYAGVGANSRDNIKKLLAEMQAVPDEQRGASFHCVLAFLSHAKDPVPLVCDGVWKGRILNAPRGEDGFGYDPIFYVPELSKTAAELPLALKNTISHRGRALQSLLKTLPDKL